MKIVEAINNIITKSDKISNVLRNVEGSEYFFIYNEKYKWSILRSEKGEYSLFLYPKENMSLEDLAYQVDYSIYKDYVLYTSEEIKTREATESFAELYKIVSDKLFGTDNILDDIINDN